MVTAQNDQFEPVNTSETSSLPNNKPYEIIPSGNEVLDRYAEIVVETRLKRSTEDYEGELPLENREVMYAWTSRALEAIKKELIRIGVDPKNIHDLDPRQFHFYSPEKFQEKAEIDGAGKVYGYVDPDYFEAFIPVIDQDPNLTKATIIHEALHLMCKPKIKAFAQEDYSPTEEMALYMSDKEKVLDGEMTQDEFDKKYEGYYANLPESDKFKIGNLRKGAALTTAEGERLFEEVEETITQDLTLKIIRNNQKELNFDKRGIDIFKKSYLYSIHQSPFRPIIFGFILEKVAKYTRKSPDDVYKKYVNNFFKSDFDLASLREIRKACGKRALSIISNIRDNNNIDDVLQIKTTRTEKFLLFLADLGLDANLLNRINRIALRRPKQTPHLSTQRDHLIYLYFKEDDPDTKEHIYKQLKAA